MPSRGREPRSDNLALMVVAKRGPNLAVGSDEHEMSGLTGTTYGKQLATLRVQDFDDFRESGGRYLLECPVRKKMSHGLRGGPQPLDHTVIIGEFSSSRVSGQECQGYACRHGHSCPTTPRLQARMRCSRGAALSSGRSTKTSVSRSRPRPINREPRNCEYLVRPSRHLHRSRSPWNLALSAPEIVQGAARPSRRFG